MKPASVLAQAFCIFFISSSITNAMHLGELPPEMHEAIYEYTRGEEASEDVKAQLQEKYCSTPALTIYNECTDFPLSNFLREGSWAEEFDYLTPIFCAFSPTQEFCALLEKNDQAPTGEIVKLFQKNKSYKTPYSFASFDLPVVGIALSKNGEQAGIATYKQDGNRSHYYFYRWDVYYHSLHYLGTHSSGALYQWPVMKFNKSTKKLAILIPQENNNFATFTYSTSSTFQDFLQSHGICKGEIQPQN